MFAPDCSPEFVAAVAQWLHLTQESQTINFVASHRTIQIDCRYSWTAQVLWESRRMVPAIAAKKLHLSISIAGKEYASAPLAWRCDR